MALAHPMTQPTFAETARLKHQAQPSAGGYWRVRIAEALASLEREARRMLQLEAQLGGFAGSYHRTIGAAMVKLQALEEQLAGRATPLTADLQEIYAHHDAVQRRQDELQARYQGFIAELALDVYAPDMADYTAVRWQADDAYARQDLALMLKVEAQLYLNRLGQASATNPGALELALRDVMRAADTYASAYRQLLNSPLNELMLKALSARREGWDWADAVLKKIERSIEEKEQLLIALVTNSGVGMWRAAEWESA